MAAVTPDQDIDVELLREESVEDLNESAEALLVAAPLSYFGTDFDIHGLVRRLNEGEILVPSFDPDVPTGSSVEGFQRRFVWQKFQMDRFVESLLLEYPVPGIFLVQQPDKKMLVLDGQQRLRTLQQFYGEKLLDGAAFRLASVADDFKGSTYSELAPEQRRTLDNTFIHAIIVRYDPSPDGVSNIYQLFERLNAGGTNLYPQEIRVALYMGELVRLIRDLNVNADWRLLYGPESDRLKDQELILRFLAFFYGRSSYRRPLKKFLNDFLAEHKDLEGLERKKVEAVFADTCTMIAKGIGKRAFRLTNAVNAALVDSVMVGVASRLQTGSIKKPDELGEAFDRLIADEEFQRAVGRATADEERVRTRFAKAESAFANVR
jgi:Protein of unknown function DUF262